MRNSIPGYIYKARNDNDGFTLIEIMVVILIIAILIAIAIPTFLSTRKVANDRSAQANLRNALTAEKILYVNDGQTYVDTASQLRSSEPAISWTHGIATASSSNVVGVQVNSTSKAVCLTAASPTGTTFVLADVGSGPKAGTFSEKFATSGSALSCTSAVVSSMARGLSGW